MINNFYTSKREEIFKRGDEMVKALIHLDEMSKQPHLDTLLELEAFLTHAGEEDFLLLAECLQAGFVAGLIPKQRFWKMRGLFDQVMEERY